MMKMNKEVFCCIVIPCLFVFMACKACKKDAEAMKNDRDLQVKEKAMENLGTDATVIYNPTEEFALITKEYKSRPADIFPTLRFEILELDSMRTIFSDIVMRGKVVWIEDYVLDVSSEKGMPGPDGKIKDALHYRYHVKNRKKYSGGFMMRNN